MRFHKSLFITAALTILPFASQAASVKSNPTLTVPGLTFNDFSCTVTKQGFAVTPSGCGKIDVSTLTGPVQGLQISSGFSAAGILSFDDATLNYHVTSSTGIKDIGLDFNGTFFGYAVASVTETVKNSAGMIVGFAEVSCGKDIGCTRQDNISLNGLYNDLYVTKDIDVTAFAGLSQISYIDQTFGDPTPAPEPSSIAMLGAGLLGVASLGRRRLKAARQA